MAAACRPAPQDRYHKLAKVGEGSCGVVFRCRDSEGDGIVAVKKVRFSYESDAGSGGQGVFGVPAAALREVAILREARGHPNVVEIRDAFLDRAARIFIVCEYLDLDLRRYMADRGRVHPRRAKLYAWQVLRGLSHCHHLCIAHRDVKPQNILVDPRADVVKLCDFSLGRRLLVLPGEEQTRRVASLWYRSPEVLLGGEADGMALDVWSAGCVLGEMLQGSPVFPGGSEIETLFLQFKLLGTPDEASWPGVSALPHWSPKFPRFAAPEGGPACAREAGRAASHLLAGLLRSRPRLRLSAEGALCHAYFGDLDRTAHAAGPRAGLGAPPPGGAPPRAGLLAGGGRPDGGACGAGSRGAAAPPRAEGAGAAAHAAAASGRPGDPPGRAAAQLRPRA